MYAGRIVELGADARALRARPRTRTRAGCCRRSRISRAAASWSGSPGAAPSPGARPQRLLLRAALHLRDRRLPRRAAAGCARSRPSSRVRCLRAEEVRASAACPPGVLEEHVQQARVRRAPCSDPRATSSRGYGSVTVVHDINLAARAARVPRAGRRVGLGQDDAGALDRAACTATAPARSCCAGSRSRRSARGRPRESAAGDPVRLPEPLRLAQPAQDDRADRAPAAAASSAPPRAPRPTERVDRDARARLARRELRRPLPRPALGRRAPARRDRPRAGGRARRCWSATRSPRRST